MDDVQLNFSPESLWLLNICLAIIMFGVALDLKLEDFKMVIRKPKAVLTGLVSQFILLPALTFVLVWILKPEPSVALGMFLVAACPGGNVSNFMSQLAKGNAALSVSLTAVATALTLFFTPFNFGFWSSLYPPSASLMNEIAIDPGELLIIILLLLVLPLVLGMTFRNKWPGLTLKILKPVRIFSILFFAAFIGMAFSKNVDLFVEYIGLIFGIVLVHNAIGLLTGYGSGRLMKLGEANSRSIAIETGIQNSGLALVIIFNFFDGLGGMALVAAWWGIWHLISGLLVAGFWSRKYIPDNQTVTD